MREGGEIRTAHGDIWLKGSRKAVPFFWAVQQQPHSSAAVARAQIHLDIVAPRSFEMAGFGVKQARTEVACGPCRRGSDYASRFKTSQMDGCRQ